MMILKCDQYNVLAFIVTNAFLNSYDFQSMLKIASHIYSITINIRKCCQSADLQHLDISFQYNVMLWLDYARIFN